MAHVGDERDADRRRRRRRRRGEHPVPRSTVARRGPTTARSRSAAGDHEIAYFATDNAEEPNVEDAKTARRPGRRARAGDRRAASSGGPERTRHGHARPPGRRRGLRRRADAVPRRRRPVEDLLRRGGRGAVRRLGGLAVDLGAGRSGQVRAHARRLGRDHADRRAGDAVVPGQAVRGLQDEVPVPRGPDRRRPLQRRRVHALPGPAHAARRSVPTQCAKTGIGRERRRRGSRSTAATRSSSTTGRTGEPQKTGSIYNFDARRARRHRRAEGLGDGTTTRSRSSASTTRSSATAR